MRNFVYKDLIARQIYKIYKIDVPEATKLSWLDMMLNSVLHAELKFFKEKKGGWLHIFRELEECKETILRCIVLIKQREIFNRFKGL